MSANYEGYTGEEIYCICRSTDCSRFMIGCDSCDEWFHGDCIGLKAEDANYIEKFFCHICRKKDPSLKIVYKKKKEKHKERDREKERDKDRDREKDRERDKIRDREKDRERDRESHREREKERDREHKHSSSSRHDRPGGHSKHDKPDKHRHESKPEKHTPSDFDEFLRKMKKSKEKSRRHEEKSAKKSSRRCGDCVGCNTLIDCAKCDFCKDMKKFGGPNRIRQKCRLRQCKNFGLHSDKKEHKSRETEVGDKETERRERQDKDRDRERSERDKERKERERQDRERRERERWEREERHREKKLRENPVSSDSDTASGKEDTTMESIPSPAAAPIHLAPKQPQIEEDSDSEWEMPTRKKLKEPKRKYQKRKNKDSKAEMAAKKQHAKRAKQMEVYTYEEYAAQESAEEEPQQCYGPQCVEPARPGSKYCSHECGLKLATNRIFEILPQRIQTWHQSPCQAEVKDKQSLERVRQQQLQARQRLVDLDDKLQQLTALIRRAKNATILPKDDSQDDESEAENYIFCVTCGHEINQRTALKHMEKCFQKFESLTSFGSHYKSRIEGDIFCDNYNPSSSTYCKRLKVLCPEHYKQPRVTAEEVCGCPLLDHNFEETEDFCRIAKKKCNRHPGWENMRRAELDLEKLRQWMKLDELFEQERTIRTDMSNRAGVMALLLHRTIDHDAVIPILKSAN